MIYRIVAALIVLFWAVMTALLVRLELRPDQSRVLEVPVSHVVKLLFEHGQQTLLNVRENGQPAGVMSFRPTAPDKENRSLEFNGSLSLHLPMVSTQRISWNGILSMDRQLNTRDFHVDLTLREPPYRVAFTGQIPERKLSYEAYQNGQLVSRASVSLDESTAPATLQQFGVSPELVRNVLNARKNLGTPSVTAKQAGLRARGERIEVYQLTIRQDTHMLAEIFVSQLGQVLLVNTSFGYTLAAEGM